MVAWTWVSISPGIRVLPVQSMTSVSAPTSICASTLTMRSPRMRIDTPSRGCFEMQSITRALRNSVSCAMSFSPLSYELLSGRLFGNLSGIR